MIGRIQKLRDRTRVAAVRVLWTGVRSLKATKQGSEGIYLEIGGAAQNASASEGDDIATTMLM
jgi:hypothetical protein